MTGVEIRCETSLAEALARDGLDSVQGVFAFDSGEDLDKPGLGTRKRTRLKIADTSGLEHTLYLKRYSTSDGPDAVVEAENILALRALKIPTMDVVAWGRDGKRSFLIVTAVAGDAMERCFESFLSEADDATVAHVTFQMADLVASVHSAGLAHRDFYASHVFLHVGCAGAELYLIDLARMFRPRCFRRRRWWVKDLAQLKFSMPPQWVQRYWQAFLERYRQRTGTLRPRMFAAAIDRKTAGMRRRQKRKDGERTG